MYKRLDKKTYKPLFELRKNPEKNIFIGAWDYLEKYENDTDVYISFTEIDKIGINPKSKYNTPIGIYCYPLREFIKKYVDPYYSYNPMNVPDKYKKSIGAFAPFAGQSSYVNFIKCKDKSDFINDMYKDYGSDKYDRDIKILEEKYKDSFRDSGFIKKNVNIENIAKNVEKCYNNLKETDDISFETVLLIVRKNTQDVSYTKAVDLTSILTWEVGDYNFLYKKIFEFFEPSFQSFVKDAIKDSKEKNPIMMIWNITRLLAAKLSNNTKQAAVKWNLILSKDLGYSGFADKSGKGYIHPSEPMQAVFLNTKAFELIVRERNIPNKKLKI